MNVHPALTVLHRDSRRHPRQDLVDGQIEEPPLGCRSRTTAHPDEARVEQRGWCRTAAARDQRGAAGCLPPHRSGRTCGSHGGRRGGCGSGERAGGHGQPRVTRALHQILMLSSLVGAALPLLVRLGGPPRVELQHELERRVRWRAEQAERVDGQVQVRVEREQVVAPNRGLAGQPPALQEEHVWVGLGQTPFPAGRSWRVDQPHADPRVAAAHPARAELRQADVVVPVGGVGRVCQVEVGAECQRVVQAERGQVGQRVGQHGRRQAAHADGGGASGGAGDEQHQVTGGGGTSR
mmetsp:Transcript_467/g.1345  ORF Transcript_467/g.1345 Transcript_467/m.1345 type:complete len:294 (-) Transcript_467:1702-2583(-)